MPARRAFGDAADPRWRECAPAEARPAAADLAATRRTSGATPRVVCSSALILRETWLSTASGALIANAGWAAVNIGLLPIVTLVVLVQIAQAYRQRQLV